MPVVLLITIVVILAAVVFVAVGRGGEMPSERTDHAPLDLGPVTATDVVLLRPPTALWGYNIQATDEAMGRIAESIRERDVRIVALEQLVTDLSREHAPPPPLPSPYVGTRRRRLPEEGGPGALSAGGPLGPAVEDPDTPGIPGAPGTAGASGELGAPGAPGAPTAPPERSHD